MTQPSGTTKMTWTAGGGVNVLLNTAVTNGGSGGHGELRVDFSDLNEATSFIFAFGFTQLDQIGKLFPEANADIAGSSTAIERWRIGLKFGFFERGGYGTTEDGRPWLVTKSGSRSGIFGGWVNNSSPDRNVAGIDYSGNSNKRTTLTLTKENMFGLELWATSDFIITPEVGFILSATHVFVDDKEMQEWPWSAQEIGLFIRLNLGYGEIGSKVTKPDDFTSLQIARHFLQEVHGIFYSWILYQDFAKPQAEGQELIADIMGGSGLGSGDMWLIPSLQTVSLLLGAGGMVEPVHYHIKAPSLGWKIPGFVLVLGKAIGYTAAGSGGDPGDGSLLTPGIAAFNNLITIGAYEIGLSEEYLFLAPFIIGGLEIAISSGVAEDSSFRQGLLGAGISTAAAWTQNPERGRETFIASTSKLYSPATYVWGDTPGMAGGFKLRSHFEDSIFYTEMGVISPALYIANLGNLGLNSVLDYDQENPYEDIETPNFILSTLGIEELFDLGAVYFNLGAGLSLMQQIDAKSVKGGAGISGNALMGIWLNSEKSSSILLGVDATAFLTDGDSGVIVCPTLGLDW